MFPAQPRCSWFNFIYFNWHSIAENGWTRSKDGLQILSRKVVLPLKFTKLAETKISRFYAS